MGKLGGKELTYHSDLDLIFLYSGVGETDGQVKVSNQFFYAKLIQRIISFLSSVTSCGYAYKLDTRLRPSGNAGVLVTTISSFADLPSTIKTLGTSGAYKSSGSRRGLR